VKANLDSHRLVLGADPATLGLATMAAESLGVTGRFDDASSLDLDSVGWAGAVFGPPTAQTVPLPLLRDRPDESR
jgi:hypothetical protein